MHYYSHNIADFNHATRHLDRLERGIYRDLIEMYYDTEQPLPDDLAHICRKICARRDDEPQVVEAILQEFFTLTERGWEHERCERELTAYREKADKARESAAKRWHKDGNANAMRTHSERIPNAMLTNNQEPITILKEADAEKPASCAAAPDPEKATKDEIWAAGKSLLDGSLPPKQAGSFLGKLCKDYTAATVLEAVRAAIVERPADPVSYLKATCQRMAGERKTVLPWYATDQGVLAKGVELGLAPHPGESMFDFKARINAKLEGKAPAPVTRLIAVPADQKPDVPAELKAQRSAELKQLIGKMVVA